MKRAAELALVVPCKTCLSGENLKCMDWVPRPWPDHRTHEKIEVSDPHPARIEAALEEYGNR